MFLTNTEVENSRHMATLKTLLISQKSSTPKQVLVIG